VKISILRKICTELRLLFQPITGLF